MGNLIDSSDEELSFQEQVEQAEMEILLLTEIPLASITRKYITFKHGENDEDEISIRTFIIDNTENDEQH